MAHTAIDIVLLPPADLSQAVYNFNNSLIPESGFLHFLKQEAVPHLSLAMTVVHDAPLLNLIGEIISTGSAFPPVKLSVLEHKVIQADSQLPLHWLEFSKERLLVKMHHKMMEVLSDYQEPQFNQNAFALLPNESLPTENHDYVKNYIHKHQENHIFAPHITLGYGVGQNHTLPPAGTQYHFTKMALYHLGPHCSCRQEIAIFELEG
jgi:hypothetical protein